MICGHPGLYSESQARASKNREPTQSPTVPEYQVCFLLTRTSLVSTVWMGTLLALSQAHSGHTDCAVTMIVQ